MLTNEPYCKVLPKAVCEKSTMSEFVVFITVGEMHLDSA